MISIVVPTFRRPETLRQTLNALTKIDYPSQRFEAIVVDDGSGDETPDVVAEFAASKIVVRYEQQSNRGVAAARNHGARLARGDLLIFCDDDIRVEPSHLQDHLATRADADDMLVNGHWEFTPPVRQTLEASPFGRFRIWVEEWVKESIEMTPCGGTVCEPDSVTACNLSVAASAFRKLGGFDETFPFAGYEDQEFSLRARKAGMRLRYDRSIRLWHDDLRVSLGQFCERQRRGALTAVLLAVKHPHYMGQAPLIVENGPVIDDDAGRRRLKKRLKALLSSRPILAALRMAIGLLERVVPADRFLHKAYWSLCGLYIFRGVREGFARFVP